MLKNDFDGEFKDICFDLNEKLKIVVLQNKCRCETVYKVFEYNFNNDVKKWNSLFDFSKKISQKKDNFEIIVDKTSIKVCKL